MKPTNQLLLSTSPPSRPAGKPRLTARRRRSLYGRTRRHFTGKGQDAETGLYYYGARYLDPRAARWGGGDPALGEYVPAAGRGLGGLPGMGGVYNTVNLHVYHYAGNNPVKYVDPDGMTVEILGDESNQSKILDWINSLSEQQYIIEDGKLQKDGDKKNGCGSKQYSDSIDYLIENGTTKIQIADTYTDGEGKQIPLPIYKNGKMQPGYTFGSSGLKIMNVTVRGISDSIQLINGAEGERSPAEILIHELAGHAKPRISGMVGNAVAIENMIMTELGYKSASLHLNHWRRMLEHTHSTHP